MCTHTAWRTKCWPPKKVWDCLCRTRQPSSVEQFGGGGWSRRRLLYIATQRLHVRNSAGRVIGGGQSLVLGLDGRWEYKSNCLHMHLARRNLRWGPTQSLVLRSLCHGKGFLPQSPRHGSYVCGLRLAATQLRVSPVLFYQFRVQEVCPDNIEHLEWLLYWQVIRVTRIQPWRG
jgi:hypothetical protein